MGTQAYSVIEQGKVDVLLQSSPRDRRVIFEEAAGISRFKLQKTRSPAAAGTGRSEPAAPLRHRRGGGQPPADRPRPGRQGPPLQGIHRPPPGAAHPGGPGRLAAPHRAAGGVREGTPVVDRRSATPGGRAPRRAKPACWKPTHRVGELNEAIRQAEGADRRQPRADRRPGIDHRARAGARPRTGRGNRPLPPAIAGPRRPGRRAGAAVPRHHATPSRKPKSSSARSPSR